MAALPMQVDCSAVGVSCRGSSRPVLARLWNRPVLHAGIVHASHAPPASSSCQQSARMHSIWHLRGPCIHSRLACRASGAARGSPQGDDQDNSLLYTLGMATLWIGISAYAFLLSPNQTPYRDQIFLRLLVGLRDPGEDFVVNQVYTALFNIMGVFPVIYASLLVPAGRSANKIPAWPFLTASFGLGVFALLPYFTFWRPIKDQQLPPPKEELEGLNRLVMKGAETPVLPALLVAVTLYEFYMAATAGGDAWGQYGKLLEESRLVHVTTLDFLCLVAFTPFWMYNDAEGRDWAPRDTWLPLLSVVPVLGPAIYLLLRPKTDTSK